MEEYGKIKSGSVDWLLLSLRRRSKGMEIYVKVDPRVEEFMASLSDGVSEPLESYGRLWEPIDEPIKVYSLNKELMYDGYVLGKASSAMLDRNNNINLSFMQFVGASKGVKFFIPGPINGDYLTVTLKERILSMSSKFFHQYIVPINLKLRITADEVTIP